MSSQIRHSDEHNMLDTSLTAPHRLDALTRRVDKLDGGAE